MPKVSQVQVGRAGVRLSIEIGIRLEENESAPFWSNASGADRRFAMIRKKNLKVFA